MINYKDISGTPLLSFERLDTVEGVDDISESIWILKGQSSNIRYTKKEIAELKAIEPGLGR